MVSSLNCKGFGGLDVRGFQASWFRLFMDWGFREFGFRACGLGLQSFRLTGSRWLGFGVQGALKVRPTHMERLHDRDRKTGSVFLRFTRTRGRTCYMFMHD